jgi:hypothetical protein
MACCAATDAASASPSPIRRATIAVVPIDSPIAMAKTSVNSEAEIPATVTASDPSRPTK